MTGRYRALIASCFARAGWLVKSAAGRWVRLSPGRRLLSDFGSRVLFGCGFASLYSATRAGLYGLQFRLKRGCAASWREVSPWAGRQVKRIAKFDGATPGRNLFDEMLIAALECIRTQIV